MHNCKAKYVSFLKGVVSFGALLPSFFTAYPYQKEDRSLTSDWYSMSSDISAAIVKFDDQKESGN